MKQIKKFESKSKQGSFIASYQLAQMYTHGIGTEVDNEKAEQYKKICATQAKNNKLRIKSLKLENFKGFDNLNIEFDFNSVTVFVGNNGSGKSSVLEALSKAFSHLIARLTTRSTNGEGIDLLEIKNDKDYALIEAVYEFGEVQFTAEIYNSRPLSGIKKTSSLTELNDLSAILKIVRNYGEGSAPLPLLAAYTVDRAIDVSTKDIGKSSEINDKVVWEESKAYWKSLTGKADFKFFFRWYKDLVDESNSESTEISQLKAVLKEKQKDLNSPIFEKLLDNESSRHVAEEHISELRSEIFTIQNRLDSLAEKDKVSVYLSNIENAFRELLPGFTGLKISRNPLDLKLKKNGKELSVLQLSQGEKSLFALVVDITRRLTLLSPDPSLALQGSGIVIIDELDLHLHPSWQQKIIRGLKSTFPNIQFIFSTHSPQVCHTVDSNNIWLLKGGKKYAAPMGIRGGISSWVLKNLFEVEERPPHDKYTKLLVEYKELVFQDKYNNPESKKIRKELTEHFGSDDELLIELGRMRISL